MGAHPLYASACVGYVGLVAHSQNIGIGIGIPSLCARPLARTGAVAKGVVELRGRCRVPRKYATREGSGPTRGGGVCVSALTARPSLGLVGR